MGWSFYQFWVVIRMVKKGQFWVVISCVVKNGQIWVIINAWLKRSIFGWLLGWLRTRPPFVTAHTFCASRDI